MKISIPIWRISPSVIGRYMGKTTSELELEINNLLAENLLSIIYPLKNIKGLAARKICVGLFSKLNEHSLHHFLDAVKNDNLIIIKDLLKEKDTNKTAVFLTAAAYNSVNIVKHLIMGFINIDVKDDIGWSAINTAILYGSTDVLKVLIRNGAAIDEKTVLGLTPLMLAAAKGNHEMCEILIKEGADIHAIDIEGWNALKYSCSEGKSITENLLRTAGAKDVNESDIKSVFG